MVRGWGAEEDAEVSNGVSRGGFGFGMRDTLGGVRKQIPILPARFRAWACRVRHSGRFGLPVDSAVKRRLGRLNGRSDGWAEIDRFGLRPATEDPSWALQSGGLIREQSALWRCDTWHCFRFMFGFLLS